MRRKSKGAAVLPPPYTLYSMPERRDNQFVVRNQFINLEISHKNHKNFVQYYENAQNFSSRKIFLKYRLKAGAGLL